MNSLPRNSRFLGSDGRIEYVVATPASEDPDGFVHVLRVSGGDGGFFSTGQVEREVEVLWLP